MIVNKCVVFFCASLYFGGAWSHQYGYEPVPQARGSLRLHTTPATWSDAVVRCALEGGVLASPSSTAVASAMHTKMSGKAGMVFIGIRATLTDQEYVSLDGTPFSEIPTPWAAGQPDNKDNSQQCLVMTNMGTLADENCSSVYRYFCFKYDDDKHFEANKTVTKCNTNDSDYKMDSRTGSCYKFHQQPLTWPKAAAACRSERAHLAVINSDEEAKVLTELFSQHSIETLRSVVMNPYVTHVGFRIEHSVWLTIFDQSLTDAGYEKWSPSEPNNENGKEYCGNMYRTGLLNDYNCDIPATFICEMSSHQP